MTCAWKAAPGWRLAPALHYADASPFHIHCCLGEGETVSYGMCARCIRKMECRFRQQGTWVVDCEYFREAQKTQREVRSHDFAQRQESPRECEPA